VCTRNYSATVLLKLMMRLRRLPLVAAPIVLAFAAAPAPVSAATVTVGINNQNNTFVNASPGQPTSPKPVTTISLGDTVAFTNDPAVFPAAGLAGGPGQHNVAWDLGDFATKPSDAQSTTPWNISRAFTKPGLYRYFCSFHGSPGGIDMAGKVTVRKADGSIPVAPSIARIAGTSGRGSVRLRFTSSTRGVAKGTLARRQGRSFRSFGSLTLTVRRGSNAITVRRTRSGRALTPGTYRLALSFSDGVSNLTTAKTLNFTISR
jgi:plastocyanin